MLKPFLKKPDNNVMLGFFFAGLLIFLQEGFNYYASFQTLAMGSVLVLILSSKPRLKGKRNLLIVFFLFAVFVSISAINHPMVVRRYEANILGPVIAILFYSLSILCLPKLSLKNEHSIVLILRNASAATVVILTSLIFLIDTNLIPFINRQFFLVQNIRLAMNYSQESIIFKEIAFRTMTGAPLRIDLFYGEPSFLAIVLFSCVVCYMLTSKIIEETIERHEIEMNKAKQDKNNKYYAFVVVAGILSMVYIMSLSSAIYAILIALFGLKIKIGNRAVTAFLLSVILVTIFYSTVFFENIEYLINRILYVKESLSASQRFGALFYFDLTDYLFGLKDTEKIPVIGFHNGFFYIVAIAGIAGISYIGYILRTVYLLSKPLKTAPLLILAVLALIMQNGAIFSPNKIVLLSLILLPLSCVRTIPLKASGSKS